MSKKKLKKMLRKAMKKGYGADKSSGFGGYSGYGAASGDDSGFPGAFGFGGGKSSGKGLLSGLGLPGRWGSGQTEQFILGALLGAAGAYVLADEELRGRIIKSAMKLYSGFTGGIEEFKEQMADLKAELEAEHDA